MVKKQNKNKSMYYINGIRVVFKFKRIFMDDQGLKRLNKIYLDNYRNYY